MCIVRTIVEPAECPLVDIADVEVFSSDVEIVVDDNVVDAALVERVACRAEIILECPV